jgi:hypothetical protein
MCDVWTAFATILIGGGALLISWGWFRLEADYRAILIGDAEHEAAGDLVSNPARSTDV